jgi:hypothetical protein
MNGPVSYSPNQTEGLLAMLGLKHWSKIIDSAARSPLGIVALAILAISGIIGLLLSKSDEFGATGLVAFSGAVGAILILAALVVTKRIDQSEPTTHDRHPQYRVLSKITTAGFVLASVLTIVTAIWGVFYFALIIGFAPGGWQFFHSTPGLGMRDLAIYNTVTLIPFLIMFGIVSGIISVMFEVMKEDTIANFGSPGQGCLTVILWIVICALLYYGAGFIIMIVVSFGNLVLYGDQRVVVVNRLHASLTYYAVTLLIFGLIWFIREEL